MPTPPSSLQTERCEEMTSQAFARMCRDCDLVNNTSVTRAGVDIAYCRARAELTSFAGEPDMIRPKHVARLVFQQFLYALMLIGDKRKTGFEEVVSRILRAVNARPNASMADFLVFQNRGQLMVRAAAAAALHCFCWPPPPRCRHPPHRFQRRRRRFFRH